MVAQTVQSKSGNMYAGIYVYTVLYLHPAQQRWTLGVDTGNMHDHIQGQVTVPQVRYSLNLISPSIPHLSDLLAKLL